MKLEDYSKYYIQGSDNYLIPKNTFVELFNEMLNWKEESKKLKEQLEYLRSGEYYNQLRFENEMLQQVVDNMEVSKEDKKIIDMTHRNTELLEENQELKKQLEEANKKLYLCTPEIPQNVHGKYVSYVDLVNEIYELKKQLEDMTDCRDIASGHRKEVQDRETILLKQQQEFIKYMENIIEELEYDDVGDEEMKGYLIQRTYTFKEILQKYLEIIGDDK